MNGKKILFVIAAILIALIIALLSINFIKSNNEIPENTEQENVVTVEQQTDAHESIVKDEFEKVKPAADKKSEPKIINPIKKVLHILPKETEPVTSEEKSIKAEVKDETAGTYVGGRKLTPEEEEVLIKIPTSKEVVVDKEIKLKSSGRYHFK